MRLIIIVILAGSLSTGSLPAGGPELPQCLMRPVARSIHLPESGFIWLPGGDFSGPCDQISSDEWSRSPAGPWELYVYTEGPGGSGRFWTIKVGISGKQESKPVRGVCMSTSTVGWRTLQRYGKGPLQWLDDFNHDGRTEFILWDSFPLNDEESVAESALVAWVYRLNSQESLLLDWDLTRSLAMSLAMEYRSPLDTKNEYPGKLRDQAADALERFARKRCNVAR